MTDYKTINPLFTGLTSNEVRQLCYIAYFGEDYGAAIPQYLKSFHISRKGYDEAIIKLQKLGYLQTHNTVMPEYYLDVLDFLAIEHKDWLQTFKSTRSYSPTHVCEYLWKLADLLRKDDFDGAAKLTKPYVGLGRNLFNVYPYIYKRAIADSRYCTLFNDEQTERMIAESLEDMFQRGELNEQTIDAIRKLPSPRHPKYKEMQERLDLYDYFITGVYTVYDSPKTLWALSMTAIKEFYEGNIEDAMALFRKAVKTQGTKAGSLPIPLLNYFYALCIIKYRIKYGALAVTDVLNGLRDSYLIRVDSSHFAARLLLEYLEVADNADSTDIQKRANMVMGYATHHMSQCYTALLANYFSFSEEKLQEFSGLQPAVPIMMHELSPYMPLSTRSKEELESMYGGKPILANIRRKASWEVLLGEIGSTAERIIDRRVRRIIYFLKGSSLSSIVEQVQKNDGTWEDDKLLSAQKLCKDGYECMDIHDSRIAMGLTNKASWQTDADIVVPNLVGTDRLFYGVEYLRNRIQSRIVQEAPYVEFSGQGNKIAILSNVKMSSDGIPHKHTVYTKDTDYKVVTLNPIQRDILAKLLMRKHLPASAAPSLRKTIESLNGILEVREDILSNIEEAAIESEGYLAIRIEPVKVELCTEYRMTFLSMPLVNGISRLVPTVGEEFVYDEDDAGQTHCVHRNMDVEEANYQGLIDYAEQFKLEFSSYNVCNLGDERVLLNFLAFCHRNQDKYVVEWPKGQLLKFKGILTEKDIDIEVKSDVDWFAVEGKAMIGVDVLGLDELLKACCNESYEGFVCIGENEYVQMTDTLKRHIAELDAILTSGERKQRTIPKYLVGTLAKSLEQMNQKVDSGYVEFRERMKRAYTIEVKVPDGLLATLRPYQEEGYKWLKRLDEWGAGACLADDMGLGKTLQALAFLLSKADCGPSLVVAPKSVIPNWVSEVKKFTPKFVTKVLNDDNDREKTVDEAGPFTLVLCTYGVLTTESELLASQDWNVACLDEAHQIKNRNTMVSKAAMNLHAQSRIILTGTPLQNHAGELWNLMQFINPGLLGKYSSFRDTYMNNALNEKHSIMLKEMTQPFILRRTKKEVLTDLPEKIEGIHYVTLSEKEFEVYETMRQRVELKFKKGKTKEEKSKAASIEIDYFEELMKLRLASCDMHLIRDLWKYPSSKVVALMEILETLMCVEDNNILVFSQFTSFLNRIKPELDSHGWDYYYLDGQTSMKKRQTMVQDFQLGKRRIFLSSLKAGGLGINLTRANYVILLDPWWNPAIENQATDRAHRLGQKRCVSVIRLISQQTIEEKILRLHEKKQFMSDDVLDGTDESYKLSYDDILDMVAPY